MLTMETDSQSTSRWMSTSARHLRRAGAVSAAIAAAAIVAGCGASSGSPSAAGSGAAAGPQFNPQLVPAGGSSPGRKFASQTIKKKATKTKKAKKAVTHHASSPKPAASSSSTGSTSNSSSSPSGSGGGTRTVTITHTITITRTRYITPHVPAGAGMPSSHVALALTHFDADHGNIGCEISGGTVRCDIGTRVWSPPQKPWSCQKAWGQGIFVGPSGSPQFVCSGDSVLDPTGSYILPGFDDKVGSVTCQVRAFGVTCFQADGRGFFIGRTGYTVF